MKNRIPKNSILWKGKHYFTWFAYKGKVPWLSNFAANTACLIDYRPKFTADSIIVDVNAYFLEDSSWAKKEFADYYLLNHELRHFDIAEIECRRIREYLSNWTGPDQDSYQSYYYIGSLSVWKDSMTEQYDAETQHSKNRTEQEIWNKKIDSLLMVTEPFRNSTVRLGYKRKL